MTDINTTPHIDQWIDRTRMPDGDRYPSFFFMLHRMDAISKAKWQPWISRFKLFCTYEGQRYRVTGCSRLGDVWLTADFNQEHGYTLRVSVAGCSGWSEAP